MPGQTDAGFSFIADTQPKLWAEMQALQAAGLEALLLTTLVKELGFAVGDAAVQSAFARKYCGLPRSGGR
jgi:hypothetical protein